MQWEYTIIINLIMINSYLIKNSFFSLIVIIIRNVMCMNLNVSKAHM